MHNIHHLTQISHCALRVDQGPRGWEEAMGQSYSVRMIRSHCNSKAQLLK